MHWVAEGQLCFWVIKRLRLFWQLASSHLLQSFTFGSRQTHRKKFMYVFFRLFCRHTYSVYILPSNLCVEHLFPVSFCFHFITHSGSIMFFCHAFCLFQLHHCHVVLCLSLDWFVCLILFIFSWFYWWIWPIPTLPCQWKTISSPPKAHVPVSMSVCSHQREGSQAVPSEAVPSLSAPFPLRKIKTSFFIWVYCCCPLVVERSYTMHCTELHTQSPATTV